VIIRPKRRQSQSIYSDTYFYKDKEFDCRNRFRNNLILRGSVPPQQRRNHTQRPG
jgi:hypothetical protein